MFLSSTIERTNILLYMFWVTLLPNQDVHEFKLIY